MIKNRKTEKIDKPQKIPKEAIDKYFVANTAEIFVPDKVVSIDDEGKIKLVKTLSKKKNIKNIKGKPVIKFEDKNIDKIVINKEGEKLKNKFNSSISEDIPKIRKQLDIIRKDRFNNMDKIDNLIKEKLPINKKEREIKKKEKELKIQELKKTNDLLLDKFANKYDRLKILGDKIGMYFP
jgi:hypothetical protein